MNMGLVLPGFTQADSQRAHKEDVCFQHSFCNQCFSSSSSSSSLSSSFGCREQKPPAVMVTGGAEVPQQLLLRLLLQLTEELTSQRSAPQGEEEGPGDPPGGVLGMHQVTVDLLLLTVVHHWD